MAEEIKEMEKTEVKSENMENEEKETKVKEKASAVKKSKDHTAVLHIYATYNNTLAHITDMSGHTISQVTGGMVTKQDRLKANPTTAMFIAKKIAEEIRELGINTLYVKTRAKTGNPGMGPGASSIIRVLSKDGFRLLNISEVTKIPRGGPKKKGGRRGRRP